MKVDYKDHMGSDLAVVNDARVSFNKESTELRDKDVKLIHYLARHNHWTPFGHCVVKVRETVPIFVARQRFKHTVGFVYSEVSRRYVSDTPEFYTPEVWRGAPIDGAKQGSSDTEITEIDLFGSGTALISNQYRMHIEKSVGLYEDLIRSGVAPEQARMVLPQSAYTSYIVTGSLAAWARAYNLRNDKHAQQEIREVAGQWASIIQPLFPVSWDALTSVS